MRLTTFPTIYWPATCLILFLPETVAVSRNEDDLCFEQKECSLGVELGDTVF